MTPEEQSIVDQKLKEVAEILYNNTPDIGSGSVESWIKQIGSRVKIAGAQWNPKNVSQILKLRCAYLNQDITLSIYA
jgi:hypothetical protein